MITFYAFTVDYVGLCPGLVTLHSRSHVLLRYVYFDYIALRCYVWRLHFARLVRLVDLVVDFGSGRYRLLIGLRLYVVTLLDFARLICCCCRCVTVCCYGYVVVGYVVTVCVVTALLHLIYVVVCYRCITCVVHTVTLHVYTLLRVSLCVAFHISRYVAHWLYVTPLFVVVVCFVVVDLLRTFCPARCVCLRCYVVAVTLLLRCTLLLLRCCVWTLRCCRCYAFTLLRTYTVCYAILRLRLFALRFIALIDYVDFTLIVGCVALFHVYVAVYALLLRCRFPVVVTLRLRLLRCSPRCGYVVPLIYAAGYIPLRYDSRFAPLLVFVRLVRSRLPRLPLLIYAR